MISEETFKIWFEKELDILTSQICHYLNIDTSCGKEVESYNLLERILSNYGFVCNREEYNKNLIEHQYVTLPVQENGYNLRAKRITDNSYQTVLFNCHVDVVPQVDDKLDLFTSVVKDGKIFGRGACDTKSNLFIVLGAIKLLDDLGIELGYNVLIDLVSDEETGGNGTLSTIMNGVESDLIVVLEPTDLEIYNGHRGCLTTTISVSGKSVHMGSDLTGISAIKFSMRLIQKLEALEACLISDARTNPSFCFWEKPLQINIGKIKGGEWPGSVPEKCKIVFNTGFIPPDTINDIERKIMNSINELLDEYPDVTLDYDFKSGLRNEAYISDIDLPLVYKFLNIKENGNPQKGAGMSRGWRVSCDARHYQKIANIPTLIFGAGSLKHAHSKEEHIEINDIKKGIFIVANFLIN